jgi:2-haloacid dehalogenase
MNRRQWFRRFPLAGCPLALSWLSACGPGNQPRASDVSATAAARPTERPVRDNAPERRQSAEVLLFDVFGTMVEWRASLTSQFQQFGRERGLNADWQALANQWQAAYLPSLEEVRRHRRPYVGLDTLRRESLDRLLPSFGLASLADVDRARLVRFWARLQAWPDTVSALTRLQRKFVIVALSNGGFAMLVDLARHARLPWDAVLSADLFRHFKPDAEVYRGATELLARPADTLTLVAAHNIDLAAARANGLKTAYVQRPTEDARPTADWNMIARDLADLADQLGP